MHCLSSSLDGSLRVRPDALNVDLLAGRVLRLALAVSLSRIVSSLMSEVKYRGWTYPSKSGVLVADVGLADVPAVVRFGLSGVEREDAVIKVTLDVEQALVVEGHLLGVCVAGVEEWDGDVGDWVG